MMQTAALTPLSGMRIVVTRPRGKAHTLSERLRELGGTVIELPTIEIAPPTNFDPVDEAARNLENYDWVIFTSVHGVQFLLSRLSTLNFQVKGLRLPKVAAIGPATASALKSAGIEPSYVPTEYLSERIAEGLGDLRGKRILLPRANISSKALPAHLRRNGALVTEVAVYRTIVPHDLTVEKLKALFDDGVDLVTFTSPSTVRNLSQVMGSASLVRLLRSVKVACIGPVTAEAVKELGADANIVSKTHTIDGLVEAILNEI